MDFSIATLLSHLNDDKLVAVKILEKKLACEDDEESCQKIQVILDALERLGMVIKERGKYRRVSEENVVEAKLRCSSKEFCFAIQDVEDAEDIYVSKNHLSNAWNGDRVLVKILKEGNRRRSPEGEVRLILERANPSLLAQVKQEDSTFVAVPLDDRLKFTIDLQENGQNLEETIDHLVHVSVLRYPLGEYPPLGKITRVLGSTAESAADTDIVSCKHDLPQQFSPEVLKVADSLPDTFDTRDKEKRRDLRKLLTFTLEDDLQRDYPSIIEHAFSIEKVQKKYWQVGVHITDVVRYVERGGLLDKVARKRGTAVYLGEKVLPLLPAAVTSRCSLIPKEPRPAISVLVTIDEKGDIVEYEITSSVIAVDHHLTFQQVRDLLSEDESDPQKQDLIEPLQQLFFTLCPTLKSQRLQRGSFDIQLDKASPYKDEGRGGTVLASNTLPARSLLTEVTILVGKVVAEHLSALNLPCLYCGQAEPDPDELEDLLKLANNLGLELSLSSEEDITPEDYQNLTRAFSTAAGAKVLNYLLQSTFKIVKYSTHPLPHFGLAYPDGYTHCVSPLQRYGDLWIQRVLKALLTQGKDRRSKLVKTGVDLGSNSCHGQITWNILPPPIQEDLEEEMHLLVTHLNDRSKIAEDAERDLEGLKKAEKMKEKTGQVFRGLITGVQSYGFFVEISDLLVEGLVHVSSLKDDWYEYRARHSCLVGRKNRIAYRLGDEVEVEVKDVDYYRQQIDLVTVGGGSSASYEDLDED
jgi:ribonuclease R